MSQFQKLNVYEGMTFTVKPPNQVIWMPNKHYGASGMQINVTDTCGFTQMVLAAKPKGGRVRLTSTGDVLIYATDKASRTSSIKCIGNIKPVGLKLDHLHPDPVALKPGMIWPGAFDGDKYHFNDKHVWVKNISKERCLWKDIPRKLREALDIYKPEGGSFMVNPFGHVITLISPSPIFQPADVINQISKFDDFEKAAIRINQERTGMLAVYVCKLEDGWQPQIQKAQNYSKPMNKQELTEFTNFIQQFTANASPIVLPEVIPLPEPDVEDVSTEVESIEEESVEDLAEELSEWEEFSDDISDFTEE